jgi:nucleoid-associated protein YgaU
MTSDTKIGLLLGLVFIFVIAFLINGLPSFRNAAHGNDMTRRMIDFQQQPGLAAQEREVYNQMNPENLLPEIQPRSPVFENLQYAPPTDTVAIRDQMDLSPLTGVGNASRTDNATAQAIAQAVDTFRSFQMNSATTQTPLASYPHIVQENENLAKIAKRYYGASFGNRHVAINRIYEANRSVLESPDRLRVGQRLTIPPLPESLKSQFTALPAMVPSPVKKQPVKVEKYQVREGDNLWKIAAKVLGDGNRYLEIIRLNSDQLEDENSLKPGMHLRLPGD